MPHSQQTQHFQLDAPQKTLVLPLVAGTQMRVTEGSIWLTLEGHRRDVWLKAHEHWTVPLNANVWISAQEVGAFTVSPPTAFQPKVTRRVRAGLMPVAVAT